MDNERALRELRKSIEELTELVNDTLAEMNEDLEAFDITDRGYKDKTMLRRLRDYNIDMRNPDDLDDTVRNLTGVINALSARRDALEKDIQRRRKLRVRGIGAILGGLDASLSISEEERDDRVRYFESAKTIGKLRGNPRIVLEELDKQIEELEFDRDAADALSTILRDPELSADYFDLLEMENKLEDEERYREEQADLTMEYNELCSAYMLFEKVERGLERTDLNPGQEMLLARDREAAVEIIKQLYPDVADEDKKNAILDGKDDPADVDVQAVLPKLREAIENVAFARNELNGIVDERVLQRDKFTVEKVDLMKQLKDSYNEKDPKARAEKQKELLKSDDLKEFFALLELKRLVSQLEKIENDIRVVENKMSRITDHNSDEYKNLLREKANLESKYSSLKQNVFDKLGNLKLPGLSKLKLDELDVQDKRDNILGKLDKKIGSEEKSAKAARKKALDRYGVKEKKGGEPAKDVLTRVNDKVTNIRSHYVGKHAERTRDDQERAEAEVTNPADSHVSAPQVNPGASGVARPGMRGGVVPPLYGNPGGAGNPGAPAGRATGVGASGLGTPVYPPAADGRPADVSAPVAPTEYRPADYKFRYLGYQKKLDSVPVQHDLQSQLDEFGKQRVEGGKVYRYEKIGDELIYLEEDLSIYLKNPKGKLNEVLDNLRDRLEDEFDDKKEFKEFLNQEENENLKKLLSKNPITRGLARRAFREELKSNGGTMQLVNMAIALNSEAVPERINEVVERTSQPYTRTSDMHKYVKSRDGKKLTISETIANRVATNEAKRREQSKLRTRTYTDGMLRPFDISDEEIGNKRERQPRDPSRGRGDGRSR